METTQEIISRLKAYKEQFAEKYGIEQLGLFGSVARGEQDEKSDIDVFIKLKSPSFFNQSLQCNQIQKAGRFPAPHPINSLLLLPAVANVQENKAA